jgi:hypothetical protein
MQWNTRALPPADDAETDKPRRTIAARDRRIARLVAALDDARAKGYVTQAEQEPPIVLSAPDAVSEVIYYRDGTIEVERADDAVDALVAEAVAQERERCAKVAEGYSRERKYRDDDLGVTTTGRTLADPRRIAAAIRAGGRP